MITVEKNYKAFLENKTALNQIQIYVEKRRNLRVLRTKWSGENNPHQYPNRPTQSRRRNDTAPRQRYKGPYP